MGALKMHGPGVFAGFGLGQLFAWWMIRQECPNAPGLVALSTFGVGLSSYGLIAIFLRVKRLRSS